jgi:hypothetical protein
VNGIELIDRHSVFLFTATLTPRLSGYLDLQEVRPADERRNQSYQTPKLGARDPALSNSKTPDKLHKTLQHRLSKAQSACTQLHWLPHG